MELFGKKSSTSLWGREASQTMGEINLRSELSEILRGSSSKPQRGHWIIRRQFDFERKSEYHDDVFREGVGGPAYEYTDTVILTRRDPMTLSDLGEATTPPGLLPGGKFIYYFEYDVVPSIKDQIFEVTWSNHTVTPRLDQITNSRTAKYNIKDVFPYRSDSGRIEYWACYAILDMVGY
jgi:hypothetical protein